MQLVPGWQSRPRTSAWPLVGTDPCCYRATGPHCFFPVGSTGQDSTMSSSDIAGYSHQVLCHYPPVLPLFIKPTVCFVLFHFSVIYLILLMALGCLSIWGCLRGVSGVLYPIYALWHWARVIQGIILLLAYLVLDWRSPQASSLFRTTWHQSGGHLGLASCPGPQL